MPPSRWSPAAWALLLVPIVGLTAWFAFARRPVGADMDYSAESAALLASPLPFTAPAAVTPGAPDSAAAMPAPAPDSAAAPPAADSTGIALASPAPDPPPELDAAEFSDWTTYEEAVSQSRANGKPVLVAFHAEWSEASHAMKAEVLDHVAAGITLRAAVIPVLLVDRVQEDGANSAEWEQLQRRYQVKRLPTLVVFSPATGKVLRQQGWHGPAQALQWIIDAAAAVK